jgi:hypothetical protein
LYFASNGHLNITGPAVPFNANTVITANTSGYLTLDGNLAAYFGGKMIPLREVILTNPTMYTADFTMGQMRNGVLDGMNWEKMDCQAASGVVVSNTTPVRQIKGTGEFWYVISNQPSPYHLTSIQSRILEVGNIAGASNLVMHPTWMTGSITLISPSSAIRNAVSKPTGSFDLASPEYTGTRPAISLENYAKRVRNGETNINLSDNTAP